MGFSDRNNSGSRSTPCFFVWSEGRRVFTQLNNDIQNYESNNETQLNNIDINNLEEEIEVISVVDDKKKKSKSKKNDKSLNDKKKKTNLIGRKKVYTL